MVVYSKGSARGGGESLGKKTRGRVLELTQRFGPA